MSNKLYFGDNLHILRKYVKDESIDLIYLDPPFNSDANYNDVFPSSSSRGHRAQIQAFDDTWKWGEETERTYDEILERGGAVSILVDALKFDLGRSDLMAYVVMMAIRISDLHRALKPTGSLYLHCDPTASHYLKIVCDSIFGLTSFRSEIIWKRSASHNSGTSQFGPVHDCILFYAENKDYMYFDTPRVPADQEWIDREYRYEDDRGRFSLDNLTASGVGSGPSGLPWRGSDPAKVGVGRHWRYHPDTLDRLDAEGRIHWPKKESGYPKLKQYLSESKGAAVGDIWSDIHVLGRTSSERLGYATKKTSLIIRAHVARIVKAR